MKKVKYYYSAPVNLVRIPALADENGNVLFVYDKISVKIKRMPRVTVASVYDPKENKMTFGAAICSPKDIFVKKIGRDLAEKRARQFPEISIVGINRRKIRETSKKYANDLLEKHLARYFSTQARDIPTDIKDVPAEA